MFLHIANLNIDSNVHILIFQRTFYHNLKDYVHIQRSYLPYYLNKSHYEMLTQSENEFQNNPNLQ